MSINQVTPPSTLPITVAMAKANGRIPYDVEDTLVEFWLRAALAYVEEYCGKAFEPQEWEATIDAFPSGEIELPFGPLVSIISVKYTDADGVEQTVDAGDYVADLASSDGWVVPTATWPTTLAAINAVRVRYICGKGNTPINVAQAVLLLAELWYENRAAASATDLKAIPFGVRDLIDRQRRMFV